MARCKICGKRGRVGRISRHRRGVASHKFSKRAPKKSRRFGANLQKTTFYVGGLKMSMVLCTRCLKKMKASPRRQPAAAAKTAPEAKEKAAMAEKKRKTQARKGLKKTTTRTRSKPSVKKRPPKPNPKKAGQAAGQ